MSTLIAAEACQPHRTCYGGTGRLNEANDEWVERKPGSGLAGVARTGNPCQSRWIKVIRGDSMDLNSSVKPHKTGQTEMPIHRVNSNSIKLNQTVERVPIFRFAIVKGCGFREASLFRNPTHRDQSKSDQIRPIQTFADQTRDRQARWERPSGYWLLLQNCRDPDGTEAEAAVQSPRSE